MISKKLQCNHIAGSHIEVGTIVAKKRRHLNTILPYEMDLAIETLAAYAG